MCPDYSTKKDHKVIEVNSTNQDTCIEMWIESQLFEVTLGVCFKATEWKYQDQVHI